MPRQGLGISLQKYSTVLKKNGPYTYGYFINNILTVPENIDVAYKTKDSAILWCVYNNNGVSKLANGKLDDGSSVRFVFENGIKGDVAKHDDGPFSYGYYFNGEIDSSITATFVDLDTKTKRFYVKGLPAEGSYIDDTNEDKHPHDFSQGIKGFITAETVLKDSVDCYITIEEKQYKNGTYTLFADGNNSEYKIYNYYPKGDLITQTICYSYISDGEGGKYDVHNTGAFKSGYYNNGALSCPPVLKCSYNVLDDQDVCGVYTKTGKFIEYSNNISMYEDGKYYTFTNGKKTEYLHGAVLVDNIIIDVLNEDISNYNDNYIEFDKGVYVGLANGYFTNGCYTNGVYDYHKPEYTPIHPKDDNINFYVYHWCGLPMYARPADGAYAQGFYNYGLRDDSYNNSTPQKSSNDEEWYVYSNGYAIKPDYSKASVQLYLDKDNIDNILLERVSKQEYTNTQYTLIKRDKWCVEKGSELVAMTDVNIEYPWQSSQWFTSQGDIINIYVRPVWC